MRQRHKIENVSPPSWWVRCALLALAGLMVVAPTWHICSMGASDTNPGHRMEMAHHSHMMSQAHSRENISNQLDTQPMPEDFCLARMLQHVLGNSQFSLVLNFNAITVSILEDHPADTPIVGVLPVKLARGPPRIFL